MLANHLSIMEKYHLWFDFQFYFISKYYIKWIVYFCIFLNKYVAAINPQ